MIKKWITIVLALLFVMPCMASAKERLAPFALISKPPTPVTVIERYGLIKNLPKDDRYRVVWFEEAYANTGLDEKTITDLVYSKKNVRVSVCKDCKIETAGMKNGKPVYHRTLNDSEEYVEVNKVGEWKPLFVLRCDNPARRISTTSQVTSPLPPTGVRAANELAQGDIPEPTGVRVEKNEVVQTTLVNQNCNDTVTIPVQDVVVHRSIGYNHYRYDTSVYMNGVIHRRICR